MTVHHLSGRYRVPHTQQADARCSAVLGDSELMSWKMLLGASRK